MVTIAQYPYIPMTGLVLIIGKIELINELNKQEVKNYEQTRKIP
jgi:hypothetical protein